MKSALSERRKASSSPRRDSPGVRLVQSSVPHLQREGALRSQFSSKNIIRPQGDAEPALDLIQETERNSSSRDFNKTFHLQQI